MNNDYYTLDKLKNLMKTYSILNVNCLEQYIKRSEQIYELEKKIGCPLEVKSRICTDRFIYLPDGKAYLIVGVRDSYFRIKAEDGWTETVDNSEYGISWWFKPDRSE